MEDKGWVLDDPGMPLGLAPEAAGIIATHKHNQNTRTRMTTTSVDA